MTGCIGIRQEDAYPEERRAPLAPDHVAELVRDRALRVLVEPSAKRCFADAEYRQAGAEISADLSPCTLVFGVKEIPAESILADKVYCAFSHTMAGHPTTMPMLGRMLSRRCTLIDYELVRTSRGRRVIFFGHFAGYAGMIDGLWAFGQRLIGTTTNSRTCEKPSSSTRTSSPITQIPRRPGTPDCRSGTS